MGHRMRDYICEECGAPFRNRVHRRSRYCSTACSGRAHRGTNGSRYNGGLSLDRQSGRWKIICRDGTQLWFYRGVAAAGLGRLLTPDEIVHHLNGDPSDDRPENLAITTRAEHMELHRAEITEARW